MGKNMTLHIQHCTKKDVDKHIKIYPSTKIYFGDYPYRVCIKGPGHPHPDYDPNMHWEVTDFLRTTNMFYKRELHTPKSRNIYFSLWDDFLWFVNWMSDYIDSVHVPVSEQHILDMHTPGLVLRDQNWYRKFDTRIEFSVGLPTSWKHRPEVNKDQDLRSSIYNFVQTNFEDYRFSITDNSIYSKWFYNYLYCDMKEWKDLEAFAFLSFKHNIRTVDKIKLFSELTLYDK